MTIEDEKKASDVELDKKNAQFWSFLCGSSFGQALGIKEFNREGLNKFDQAYFDYYPYLLPYIAPQTLRGKRVLEIGLGMGSVGRALSSAQVNAVGLDISSAVTEFYKESCGLFGLKIDSVTGSAAKIPFPDAYFDNVVSIGCLHHTGSVANCLKEIARVLKPGGQITGMIYNRYSFRQWRNWPRQTWNNFISENFGIGTKDGLNSQSDQISCYDSDKGVAAPFTEFYSKKMLGRALKDSGFLQMDFALKNFDDYSARFGRWGQRKNFLGTLDAILGLDIYFKATK